MAYAALISLQESLNQILPYPTPKIKTFTSLLLRFRPSVVHNQRKQIRSLLSKLEYLLEFLEDSSQKIDERTCSLVTRIRDAAYEAQNIADLYCYEKERATIRHVPMPDLQKIIQKIDDIESDIRKQTGSTMEKAKNIESILVPNDDLQLYKSFRADSSKDAPKKTPVGFDECYVPIMDQLMGRESALRVVSITGMGGIGKTTLARNIYDDASIKYHFDICVWVVISQSYSIRGILLGILDSMKMLSDEMHGEDENKLKERLYQDLKGKRYLITIDDIWDISVLDEIRSWFPNDDNGSRILLTTRLEHAATYVSSSGSCLHLRLLNSDESWSLLCSKVFGDKKYCPLELEQIGRKISQTCQGHPLSLVVMGGLLSRIDKTKEAWLYVEQNVISTMASDYDFAPACLGILKLSYDYLPQWLKPCFLYMAHFQEDEEISVSKLIKLWVAEGFLKQYEHQNPEAVAEKCLKELVDRNMIIISKQKFEGKIKTCRIHDLLLDLCIREADKEKFLCVMTQKTPHNHLRLSIHSKTPNLILSNPISSFSFVRSLLYTGSTDHLSSSVFLKFKLLRVVDALKVAFPNFPHELLKLLNLMYISFTCQAHIPASISNLRNLQTLIIHQENTANLPVEIWNMTHLRNVEFENASLPYPIGKPLGTDGSLLVLKNLRTLSGIRNLRFTKDVLARIPSIERLKIFYDTLHGPKGWSYYEFQNLVNLRLLEALKIYVNIDIHKMRHLTGSELEFQFPSSLKELTLSGCSISWEDLSVVGSLPNLEVLKLRHGSCIGDHWSPNEGEFPRLKLLLLQSLNLMHWELEHDDLFPSLELLILRDCYALQEIPYQIREIPSLTKIELDKSNESLLVSAMEIEEWLRDMGNDDFQVIIHTSKKSSSNSLIHPKVKEFHSHLCLRSYYTLFWRLW